MGWPCYAIRGFGSSRPAWSGASSFARAKRVEFNLSTSPSLPHPAAGLQNKSPQTLSFAFHSSVCWIGDQPAEAGYKEIGRLQAKTTTLREESTSAALIRSPQSTISESVPVLVSAPLASLSCSFGGCTGTQITAILPSTHLVSAFRAIPRRAKNASQPVNRRQTVLAVTP